MRRLCLLEVFPEENREGDAVRDEERLKRGMMPWLFGQTAGRGRQYLESTIVLYCTNETSPGREFSCHKVGYHNAYVQKMPQSRRPSHEP